MEPPLSSSRSETRGAALVTGASGGIGYELAKELAARGHDLVLVARSRARLEEVAAELRERFGAKVTVLPIDLRSPEAPEAILAEIDRRGVALELLVNNAGFGAFGRFVATDLASELEMMQVNMVAL